MIAGVSHMTAAFSALRVAESARAREESLQQQVATGRRVNSAKDDGAAFQIELAAKSDLAQWRGRERILNKLEGGFELQNAVVAKVKEIYVDIAETVLRARDTVAGSAERRAIAEGYNGLIGNLRALTGVQTQGVNGTPSAVQADGRFGIRPLPGDSVVGGVTWQLVTDQNAFSIWASSVDVPNGVLVALRGYDLVNASDTQLQDVQTTARRLAGMDTSGYATGWATITHAEFERLRIAQSLTSAMQDRTEAAIGTLTGADMGKVSTDLDAARTRAAVANEGIARAIQIYGRAQTSILNNAISDGARVRAFA
jgi:flagellin